MNPEEMTREQLIEHVRQTEQNLANVIVLWGDKRELLETLKTVRSNDGGEYTDVEARNARTIIEAPGAFDELIEMIRDSFERGGINYAISEKLSALMDMVAEKHGRH